MQSSLTVVFISYTWIIKSTPVCLLWGKIRISLVSAGDKVLAALANKKTKGMPRLEETFQEVIAIVNYYQKKIHHMV